MAAPAGVGSGSAPEPAAPEPVAVELVAVEPVAVEPAATEPVAFEPGPGQSVAAEVPAGERRGVSRLVVAGVILVLVAVAAAAGVLVVATHGLRHKTLVTYRPAAVFSLRAGDCLNSSQNGLSVTILSCATPHQAEVFATFSLSGSSWPGEAAVQQQAGSGCATRIAGYLNPQLLNAGLTQQYVYPNQEAWQAGVRTVVCEVSSDSGPLSGSVRNSA
jgi:Septum formation